MAASRLAPLLVVTMSTTSAVTTLTNWLGSATANAGATNATAAAMATTKELKTLYIGSLALIAHRAATGEGYPSEANVRGARPSPVEAATNVRGDERPERAHKSIGLSVLIHPSNKGDELPHTRKMGPHIVGSRARS